MNRSLVKVLLVHSSRSERVNRATRAGGAGEGRGSRCYAYDTHKTHIRETKTLHPRHAKNKQIMYSKKYQLITQNSNFNTIDNINRKKIKVKDYNSIISSYLNIN